MNAAAAEDLLLFFPDCNRDCTMDNSQTWKFLNLLLILFTKTSCRNWPPNVADLLADGDEFDFVVVGSGSAGSPVAARLAERGQKVLLLEAGGVPPLSTVVPGLCVANPKTDIDWQFISQYDDRACQSLSKKRCHKSRGKVLGGSSSINFMIYIRGNKVDYDDWNIPSWTYDEMLPYFLRMESLADYNDLTPELKQYHNNDGPLRVSLLNASAIEWRDHLFNAYREIGFQPNADANGPSQIGVTITHATVFAGERQSTAEAYLVPNARNKHLHVAYNSFVTKVIIDKYNVATGIRVNVGRYKDITVRAKKEIIISAGSINTPQILMLSGIGPAFDLKKYGIPVFVNNPHVGQNLHDHPSTPIILTANTGVATPTPENEVNTLLDEWLLDRSGLLATTYVSDISAFVDTAHNSSVPDFQYVHGFISRNDTFASSNLLTRIFSFTDEVLEDIQELNRGSEILIVIPIVLRPESRGSIRLASGDPYDHPLIYGNTLVQPDDYATYLRGIRIFEKLLTTPTFKENGVKLARIQSLKKCNDFKYRSDDYWLCYHDHLADAIFHPVGTASIGHVIDERLRVYGVQRLRVADASVMPVVPRGNTNAPTIAVGERAADFIAEDNGFYGFYI